MYCERQASRTGVLSLLRTVHCDLEIVNYKLLTVTSASETWIHSQWIGDCAECSWSVTCVLLIELFSFMHIFSISVLTFCERRVCSFFGDKACFGNCRLTGSYSNQTPDCQIGEADANFELFSSIHAFSSHFLTLLSGGYGRSPFFFLAMRTFRYERWTVNC